jgi:hypothetical protein
LLDDYLDGRVSLEKIRRDYGADALPDSVIAAAG